MMSAPTALRDTLDGAAGRVLLRDANGDERTGGELAGRVARLAGALLEACGPRPRVGLWYRNSLAAVEAFLAVQWLGGARVPVDPGATPAEAAEVFRAAGVSAALVDLEHREVDVANVLVHDDLKALQATAAAPPESQDAEAAYMVYPRSVVAGQLFGVTLSYRNWGATLATNIGLYRSGRYGRWHESGEHFMSLQQIMHGTGFVGTFPFLAMGLPQTIVPTFSAAQAIEIMDRDGVTATMVVPAMLEALLSALTAQPLAGRSLRHLLYGGGAVSGDSIRGAVSRLGPVLAQLYGRVEGGWPLALLDAEDHASLLRQPGAERVRSCGRPVDGVEWRLRSDSGRNDSGELLVRSAMTSREYADADGWCSLGDVMRCDAEGYLTYERRLDRMINTGYHVYPDEIEASIRECEGVAAVTVRGEPHPRWGQQIVADIVPRSEEDPAVLTARVRSYLQKRLAGYKVPREFYVLATPTDGSSEPSDVKK